MIPVNTKVNLIDQTTKVGWSRGTLFVERQAPLEGTNDPAHMDPAELDRVVKAAMKGVQGTVDWDTARLAFQQANGVPVRIGERNFERRPAPVDEPAQAPVDAAAVAAAP
jgi:hypothetical protein